MNNLLAKLLFFYLCITLLFNSCIPEEEELLYPGFAILSLQSTPQYQTQPIFNVSGEIEEISEGVTLSDYGIFFTKSASSFGNTESVNLENADFVSSLGTKSEAGIFTIEIDLQSGNFGQISQDNNNKFSFRAFATYDDKTIYSDKTYGFEYSPDVQVDFSEENGIVIEVDRAQIPYTVKFQNAGISILQHGICWDTDISLIPTVNSLHTENFDNVPNSKEFTEHLNNLEKGQTYIVRAYAIDNDSTVYYSALSNFSTLTSGWRWGSADLATTTAVRLGSFSINGIGYFGLGVNGPEANLSCWSYNVETDSIIAIAEFPGIGRTSPVSFTINGKAYVGLGEKYDDYTALNDFWEYDPLTDSWRQIADFIGETRFGSSAAVFSTINFGYVGLGIDNMRERTDSFMKYDPVLDAWSAIASYPDGAVNGTFSGSVGNLGIVGLGSDGNGKRSTLWSYDEVTDNWSSIPALTIRPDFYTSYKVNDRQFILGTASGSLLPIHLEYDAAVPLSPWSAQGIPFLLSNDPFLFSTTLTWFSYNDRVVFFDYQKGVSIEYLPND